MNKSLALIALINLFIGLVPVHAQSSATTRPMATDLAPVLQRIRADRIFQHVRTLASDEFEGRAPGTPGETLTVNYLTSQFREAGLKPGNPDGTYVQRVPLIGYKTTPSIELKIGEQPFSLRYMDDFVHDYPRLVPEVNAGFPEVVF